MREISFEQLHSKPEHVAQWLQQSEECLSIVLDEHTRAILQRAEDFEHQRQALAMMQLLLNGEQDISGRRLEPHEEVMQAMRQLLET